MEQNQNALKEAGLFFALTIGLSYLVFWGPLALFGIPTISFVEGTTGPVWAITLFMFGGFVPSLVAIFLTRARNGKKGLRQLWQRAFQVRIGWRWYLATLAVVVMVTLGQLFIIRLLGQSFDYTLLLAQLGSFVPLIIIGPLSEELGWRGYALDRLQTKYSAIASSLMVGVVWGMWHLPLFFMVGTSQHELHIPFIGFVCGVTALSVIFTWLQNNTGGSVWTAILFHWLYTYTAQVIASGVNRSPVYNWLEYLPHVVVAGLIAGVWRSTTVHLQKNRAI